MQAAQAAKAGLALTEAQQAALRTGVGYLAQHNQTLAKAAYATYKIGDAAVQTAGFNVAGAMRDENISPEEALGGTRMGIGTAAMLFSQIGGSRLRMLAHSGLDKIGLTAETSAAARLAGHMVDNSSAAYINAATASADEAVQEQKMAMEQKLGHPVTDQYLRAHLDYQRAAEYMHRSGTIGAMSGSLMGLAGHGFSTVVGRIIPSKELPAAAVEGVPPVAEKVSHEAVEQTNRLSTECEIAEQQKDGLTIDPGEGHVIDANGKVSAALAAGEGHAIDANGKVSNPLVATVVGQSHHTVAAPVITEAEQHTNKLETAHSEKQDTAPGKEKQVAELAKLGMGDNDSPAKAELQHFELIGWNGKSLFSGSYKDIREAVEHAARAKVWMDEVDLSGGHLAGANLNKADLPRANLKGADLRGANLAGATLRDADLRGADLRGANLSGAELWGVSLDGAKLDGASFTVRDLKHVWLGGGASFEHLNIIIHNEQGDSIFTAQCKNITAECKNVGEAVKLPAKAGVKSKRQLLKWRFPRSQHCWGQISRVANFQ